MRLMEMISQKEDHIRKLKYVCKQKSDDIKSLSDMTESRVVRNLFAGMSSKTANFLISQLRCATRDPKGRRWTMDDKIVALCLFKRSPKCYSLLSKIVAMPSRRTLLSLLEKVPFNFGINEHLFKHINDCLNRRLDRCCVLLFDEMDIMENLFYDAANDIIIGYEQFTHTNKFANRVLVFMCQGIVRNWKQPVAYYFSSDGVASEHLKMCVTEVLTAATQISGLDVVATICDMGSTNVKALKEMGSSVDTPYLNHEGQKIFTVYDPPHLLKCTVSLFRKHSVFVRVAVGEKEQNMEAKFSDIVQAYDIDSKSPLVFRALYKIKPHFLAPVMRFAMKVNIAAQIMSRTVAAFLYSALSKGLLEQRSIATATFVQQVDELFDSFNGSRPIAPNGKEIKCCITEESPHVNYWTKAFNIVKNWVFRRITKKGNLRSGKPPSQIGWMVSLRAMQGIWDYVKSKGISMLRPRSFNQDALENLFGAIRGGCGSGDNPTAHQFVGSLKSQVLNGLANEAVLSTNCEEDEGILLSNMRSFLIVQEKTSDTILEPGVAPLEGDEKMNRTDLIATDIADAVTRGDLETLSVAYVSGFIARRILKEVECENCSLLLCSTPSDLCNHFIMYKDQSDDKILTYPSENLVIVVGHAITKLEEFLPQFGGRQGIGRLAQEYIIENIQFSWFSCPDHKDFVLTNIIKGVVRIGIPWWCKRKNSDRKEEKKELKSTKRKIKKFRHE